MADTTPDQSGIPVDMQAVLEVLREDPLSAALLDRAQYLTILRAQEKELRYLREAVKAPGTVGEPSQGGQRVEG